MNNQNAMTSLIENLKMCELITRSYRLLEMRDVVYVPHQRGKKFRSLEDSVSEMIEVCVCISLEN